MNPPPPSSRKVGLKRGVLLNWSSLVVNFGVAFFMTPFVVGKLGAAGFGLWMLVQSFSGYYGLLNVGLGSALQRFINRDLARDDHVSLQCTVSTAVMFLLATGATIMIVVLSAAPFASSWFDLHPEQVAGFRLTFSLCAAAVVFEFFTAITSTMLVARERFDLSNGLAIARNLLQAALMVAALSLVPDVQSMALVLVSVSTGWLLVTGTIACRQYPQLRLSLLPARWGRLKELLGYGSWMVVLKVSNLVRLRLGNLVIATTTGVAAVAQFAVASNLVMHMNTVVDASLRVLNPRFTRLDVQARTSELQRLFRVSLFGSSTLALGIALMMLVCGERFILFWLGPDFGEAARLLQWLALAYGVALAQAPGWNLMQATARHRFMSIVSLIESAVIVAAGLWLAQAHGAIGFTWATVGAMLLTKIFIQVPFCARLSALPLRDYLRPMMGPAVAAAAIVGACRALGVGPWLMDQGVMAFAATALAVGGLYMTLVVALSYNQDFVRPLIGRRFALFATPTTTPPLKQS